ncbi:MAG: haloacid dehalogenase-like hydrolase [Clostridia bacterium]|nr:haloacid dehalogenase-like hydrolase [Clostridia bacterium]
MKKKNLSITLFITVVFMICSLMGFALAEEPGTPFTEWNEEAASLKTLISYVETVTDINSDDYIPEEDRIATFDMDGTLCAELNPTYLEYYLLARRILTDETYQPDEEMLEFGRMLRDHALDRSFPDGMDMLHATHAAKAYAGMTLQEFADFVTRQIARDADGFEGMTYAGSFYLPMVEVVDYLQANGFKCYICSGSDRFICRTFIEGMLDIPYENIIGMDVQLKATNQGDADGLNYVFGANDTLERTDRLLIKNLKTNKVLQIAQHIGRQPVLSFGNSSGDVAMHNYAIYNNVYKSAAFMLVADDEVRDYGNAGKAADLRTKWEESGFNVISMANDWKTIYGDDVKKTGEFHWMEDLAEDRVAAADEETVETEEAPAEDIQYVMYLGTNAKGNNKPVFTQAEAKEQLKAILLKHFGGYTIQEADGGWVDGDTAYQEYTLVIYLSDTTEEKVHAAADELIQVFDQSSVLIQKNPTRTEFYSGRD